MLITPNCSRTKNAYVCTRRRAQGGGSGLELIEECAAANSACTLSTKRHMMRVSCASTMAECNAGSGPFDTAWVTYRVCKSGRQFKAAEGNARI